MLIDQFSDARKSFFDSQVTSVGLSLVSEASIYRNGISGIVYIYKDKKWQNIQSLDLANLPSHYRRAILNSVFYGKV